MADEISPDASRRICTHMNEDHAATVHAMVLNSCVPPKELRNGVKVQNARMKSITLQRYTLSFVVCNGDLCDMRTSQVNFNPPLSSARESR